MRKIEKPVNKTYWSVSSTDGSILHEGQTEPNQVTETGLNDFESVTEDEGEHLNNLSPHADKFPDLPQEGEEVEEDQIYNHNGSLYKAIQSHTRTEHNVDDIPALFTAPKQAREQWVQPTGAHDAYQTGDIVTYEGQAWISKIDANTTVPDGDEPHNRYWEPYNE